MTSLVTLIALNPAHAASETVLANANRAAVQADLDNLCQVSEPNTLRFPAGSILIEGGIGLRYPNPDNPACLTNPGDLTIFGDTNQGSEIIVGDSGGVATDLFTFGANLQVEIRDISIRGLQFGDAGTEGLDPFDLDADGEDEVVYTQCAGVAADSPTRGIHVDNSDATAPSQYTELFLDNVDMRCLFAQGDGGAVFMEGGAVHVTNSRFVGNDASGSGGAIAVTHAGSADRFDVDPTVATLEIGDNTFFEFNDALFGGAISNDAALNSTIVRDSYFFSNTGSLGAGALQLDSQHEVFVERNQFDEQNSEEFQLNQRGGALAVQSGNSLMFKNNIVCGSWAGRGGALYVDSVDTVDVVASVFAENGAIEFGGGVYFSDSTDQGMDISVVNNTFAGNESGRLPDFINNVLVDYVIGGGGAATFFGVNPVFQNNIVAYTDFGGGIFGEYVPFTTNGFQIGDPLVIYNNLFFQNSDGQGTADITGDFATVASHPSNLIDADPEMQYLGLGEFNCVPEAFYTTASSPAINNGGGPPEPGTSIPSECFDYVDISVPQDFIHDEPNGPCDIGAFGGEFALWRKDTDQDGVANLFDCNDLDPDISPNQPEVCDFDDNNCDGVVDENLDVVWYADEDQDGDGDRFDFVLSCTPPGGGRVLTATDCDDTNASIYGGAPEICDGIDNNCDDVIDDGLTYFDWYVDADGDSYGAASGVINDCANPGGRITTGGDCDDTDPNVSPSGREVCDGIDNDCDGRIDADDDDGVGLEYFYPDEDGDGYGNVDEVTRRCSDDPPPAGINVGGDCNDADPEINSGAPERCLQTGIDEDCDGIIDEIDENTVDALKIYADADGDGVGSSTIFELTCATSPPPGYVTDFGDCDDNDANIGVCNQGCGCSAGAVRHSSGFLFLAGLLGMVARRRR